LISRKHSTMSLPLSVSMPRGENSPSDTFPSTSPSLSPVSRRKEGLT